MSIARRFQSSHHWPYRVGDAAVPAPATPPDPQVEAAKQTGFLVGALVGVGFAVGIGYLLHDNKRR